MLCRTGPPANDTFPQGQCFNWCKDGQCKFSDQSQCNYKHDDQHKAKFPNAAMNRRAR